MRMLAFALVAALLPSALALTWETTEFMFVFGDSYTTTGFNISAGVDSPDPGFVSSNGPNWVQSVRDTFNVANTKIFDLASGGATTDAALVTPFEPTVLSLVDQVAQFDSILASKPIGAQWSSNNSLFAIMIGINDVGNSWSWTNVTQSGFHMTLLDRYFGLMEDLFSNGARSFLFINVPAIDRAPLFVNDAQGPGATAQIRASLADYNLQLAGRVASFQNEHAADLDQVVLVDANGVFNTLLDNASVLGFVNSTGFCAAYENGTPSQTTQIDPCAPVSNYFWLNTLHPLFSVHTILAHDITTALST